MTDPILRPFQRLLPPTGGLDFSPIIAILAIQLLVPILVQLLNMVGVQILHLP
ncbi:MAG TPA: YggT family protein [Oscillatoriaceae cyanobacterium]